MFCLTVCCLRLDQQSGKLYTAGRIDTGTYQVKVKVYDSLWRHEVVSTVTVNVKNIPEEAVINSGSIRLSGRRKLHMF